jgi:regulator of RNase E activity RraB
MVLQIYRTDHVDLESINAIVLQLFDLSEKYNANYDGWETSVEK